MSFVDEVPSTFNLFWTLPTGACLEYLQLSLNILDKVEWLHFHASFLPHDLRKWQHLPQILSKLLGPHSNSWHRIGGSDHLPSRHLTTD